MTVSELSRLIGTTVNVRFEEVVVACMVNDAKTTFGRDRLLIRPVGGSGEQWIEFSRLVNGKEHDHATL